MELITTHVGADFDAFASMLAARRLFPDARLFFPGSQEESVRRLVETGLVAFDEVRRRQVEPADLTRVVLCDSRRRHRLGVVAEWLEPPGGIEVLAFDHHAPSNEDLAVSGGVIDPEVGATSTLMAEELRRRGLGVAANEATVLLMGIYEDTASLTQPGTSPRDLEAAAWLLAQGGSLEAVRRFAVQHLDPVHLDVLHRMSEALEVHLIRGQRVGLVALELGEYIGEMAPLANRCLEIFELPLLFAVLGEGDGAAVIARGEVAGFDLGEALAPLGGGGHATAAAARVKGVTALELRERLLAHLAEVLPPAARAAEVMVRDFFHLPPITTVAAAKALLNARRVNAAPVVDPEAGGRVVGAVTRQLLDAALQHDLGDRPVAAVMTGDVVWVRPDDPVEEVGERMLTRHPRFVLVGDEEQGRAVGLVTRMGVLRHLHGRVGGEGVERRSSTRRQHAEKVAGLLARQLPEEVRQRIEVLTRVARAHEIPTYLAGGFVRDLLLGRENRDLDVVVEGDGLGFARLLAGELGGRVREHREFLTAVVVAPDGAHLDVATARSEFYRAPAALPEVATSPLRQDLYRRDFTVNALALRLFPGEEPEVIDYFGGRQDLAAGVLRVLHSLSLIDDPTRALRAVRLEQRLGFHLSPETLRLLRIALTEGVFDRLSGRRLREELVLLLDDPAIVLRGLERLGELGLLRVLQPRLELTAAARQRLREAVAAYDWYRLEGLGEPPVAFWRLALALLAGSLTEEERQALADRLDLAGEVRRGLVDGPERLAAPRGVLGRPGVRPHQVEEALAELRGEELLQLLAEEEGEARTWVRRHLTELSRLEIGLRGAELVGRGVAPGPAIGRALREVRRARLDGLLEPAGELDFALRYLAEEAAVEAAR
jgi:tRNA nucleotidyltransferase (CCA-adding enzyme)